MAKLKVTALFVYESDDNNLPVEFQEKLTEAIEDLDGWEVEMVWEVAGEESEELLH